MQMFLAILVTWLCYLIFGSLYCNNLDISVILSVYSVSSRLNDVLFHVQNIQLVLLKNSLDKFPVDTGRKLNVHKTFRRRPGRLLTVLCTFNLRPVSTGILFHNQEQLLQDSYLKIHWKQFPTAVMTILWKYKSLSKQLFEKKENS